MNIKEFKAIHGRLARIHEKLELGIDTIVLRVLITKAMTEADFQIAQIEKRRSKGGT